MAGRVGTNQHTKEGLQNLADPPAGNSRDIAADDPVTALRMEQAENNVRKDFTVSEKTEIARRIEEALGNRQGQRTELLQNFAEVAGNSRDIAAQSVGWSGLNVEGHRPAR